MRLPGSWGRTVLAVAVTAGAALSLTAGPAVAAPVRTGVPGTTIEVTPRPDGWHGLSNGEAVDYWMTGSDGTPQPASGAVFLPSGPAPAGGWPILAYDHGTSGLGANCGGQSDPDGAPYPASRAKEEQTLRYFLSKGFAVVAPDYLGLGRFRTGPHPYLELKTEATATIDLVRAARATHPELSRTWAVAGASQGGQAALGAAHLQRTYAPDLDFRGTIAIDPESDVEKVLPLAGPHLPDLPGSDGVTTSFIAMTLAGLRESRPDLDVNGYLSPRGREVLDSIGDLCLDRIIDRTNGVSLGDMLAKPLGDDRFRTALTDYMAVPTSGYDAPILLLVNATDTTVPSPLHAALAAQFAANGVDFRTVVGTGKHVQLNPQMWSAIDEFTARVLATPTER
ncbi:lipase family protein [Nocardia terpenica]|uniref:Lipase n=1 Tax=Nocardia terpenica TaxID=455432 RepID=A0A164KYT4_9NOCA|nr:alpha/beta fold hydrolase [Nocardia terpenica]KZM71857.1 lipase [Nocardia terpenica]NQE90297.1 alpha/beta fold hydrolase [Nocardia terpenica]